MGHRTGAPLGSLFFLFFPSLSFPQRLRTSLNRGRRYYSKARRPTNPPSPFSFFFLSFYLWAVREE